MAEKELFGNSEQLDCSDCVNHGGDWDCDHVQCHKGADTISRVVESVPSAQQDCDGCKWSDAIGYGECHHCKRAFEDMYEKGEQP